jgi:hypothetical protein
MASDFSTSPHAGLKREGFAVDVASNGGSYNA